MLERPDLQDENIIACLLENYGVRIVQVSFLPLGADKNSAAYLVVADDNTAYFFKTRRGEFDETSVLLPGFLREQLIAQIIAPLPTRKGRFWCSLDDLTVILYPFVQGQNAYKVKLSNHHWFELGTALRRIHTIAVPHELASRIQQENWSERWRELVKRYLERVENDTFDEPVAIRLAAFLNDNRKEILELVVRAEQRARILEIRALQFVLCHSDMHAGNILIDTTGALYIVDWDAPILAPKERDLMFVGGGLMGGGRSAHEEEALFHQGYGQTQIDPLALAYYRYERIIQDIAAYCDEIFLTDGAGQDREQALYYLTSNFLPNGTIELAYKTEAAQ